MNILKVKFFVYFKDGREFEQEVDLVFERPEQISSGIDNCFARFWRVGYVEKQEVAEKLVNYGPQYIERVEMVQSRVQPVNLSDMESVPPPPNAQGKGGLITGA